VLPHRLGRDFGRMVERLGLQAQLFDTLPVVFSLLLEVFGSLSGLFLVLASLFIRGALVLQTLTALFGSHAVLFRSGAQPLGRLVYFFADLALCLRGTSLGCVLHTFLQSVAINKRHSMRQYPHLTASGQCASVP
jgi:hypothetical protein